MIISIDGPAGSGKSTVADALAKKLGFYHFNSGSLYRAITAHLIDCKIFSSEDKKFTEKLRNCKIKVQFIGSSQLVFVNDIDYTKSLRDIKVSELTPKFSINPTLRNLVDECQKEFASKNDVVIDGRDIGSFVLPNADVKFYLDCDIDERALRRYKELKNMNESISLEDVKNKIAIRDKFDRNKQIAPLTIPNNAIIIDSTFLSIDEVVDKMLKTINLINNK